MSDSQRRSRQVHSSGGAVVSVRKGEPHVAMIATRKRTRWGLPKGAIDKGETIEQAALREVWEETGIHARIVAPLDRIEYVFRAGDHIVQKAVDFYFMRFDGGELRPQLTEVDDVEWVSLDKAVERASFDSERNLLKRVCELWAEMDETQRAAFAVEP